MRKKRRAGATETYRVSVARETKRRLEAAFERAWRWYGGAEPTRQSARAIRVEWGEGWKLACKVWVETTKAE
jgi:hypothetical protein